MSKKLGWGAGSWGVGEGQSFSLMDHLLGKGVIHSALWGKSYEDKYAGIGHQLGGQHALSQAALLKGQQAIKRGFGGAQDALNLQGGVATKALLDREQQQLAGSKQSMISRGLYDSTAQDAAVRGINADTNQGLAGLNASLAQLHSNIKIGEGQALADSYGNMAASEDNYNNLLLQLGLNTQYGEQGGAAGLVGGIFGSLFG